MDKIISVPSLMWDKGATGDGGRRLWITTNELDDEQKSLIMKYGDNKTFGFMFFKEGKKITDADNLDLPDVKMDFKKDKTPGQRLRNTIFIYWQQQGGKENFDPFYKRTMENIINKVKERLE